MFGLKFFMFARFFPVQLFFFRKIAELRVTILVNVQDMQKETKHSYIFDIVAKEIYSPIKCG